MATTFPFPASPTLGQTQALTGGRTVFWDGSEWISLAQMRTQVIPVACSDEITALVAGVGKVTFVLPLTGGFQIVGVAASLTTAQASGSIFTVDINADGVSILSTKLTIDNTEKSSSTAATPAVLSSATLAGFAEITIDIDQIGNGSAKGLKCYLLGYPL